MGEFLENAGYLFEQMNAQSQTDDNVSAILNNQSEPEKDE
jgi:hypothetical protein